MKLYCKNNKLGEFEKIIVIFSSVIENIYIC
jgi:hypothetical protein